MSEVEELREQVETLQRQFASYVEAQQAEGQGMALRSSAPPRKTHPRPRPARWEAVAEHAGTSAALPATYPRSNDRAVTSRPAGRRQSLSESAHLPIAVPAGAVTRVKGSGHIGMVTFAKTILHRRSLAADGFRCSCRAIVATLFFRAFSKILDFCASWYEYAGPRSR